jgi:hypothetical protein
MPEFDLVKTGEGTFRPLTAADAEVAARYARFKERLEPGEFYNVTYKQPRNPAFHRRKFFALLNIGFEAWEPERGRKRLKYKGQAIAKNFEAFREDITILAGFYEVTFDLKGRMSLKAKSIAFHNMEEDEFSRVYEAVVKVVLEQVLTNYKRDDLDRVVEEIQRF